MLDPTETIRRDMIAEQRAEPLLERADYEARYGTVYDTAELSEHFTVKGFMAPLVVVTRKSDGKVGSLEFTHYPRFYYNFVAD